MVKGTRLKTLIIFITLLLSACRSGPQVDEGIITIHDCDSRHRCTVEADLVKPDKSLYELRGASLDGYYIMSPQHRRVLLNWAKANCKDEL